MAQDPRALLQKADKAAAGAGGGFSLFGGRQEKWENAADLYTQAANAFRVNNQNKEAGQAFEKCAAIQNQNLNEPDDAANTLTEAYKVYRKSEPKDAARCLESAIARYTAKSNFRRAATHKHNLGEIYEKEIGNRKKAIESYEQAAGWFESDNADALANKSWLEAADLSALEGDYYKAIEIFEKVAAASVANNLMKYSVKGYLFKAGLCHLAVGDNVTTNRAFENYKEMDSSFMSTNEHTALVEMFEQIKKGEEEKFEDAIFAYHKMNPLDPWKRDIVGRIKASIGKKTEVDEDDFS